MRMQPARLKLILALALAVAAPAGARAQDSAGSFYAGRTGQPIVGSTPGSRLEFYLRAFVNHFARHPPGSPTIVVQHMPGAGSLKATAYLANLAPKDGSVFGIINPVNTIEPLLDPSNARFDP